MKIIVTLILSLSTFILYAQDISMTITQDNLALVKETRSLTLVEGINSVQVKNLPFQLDPKSVYFFFTDHSIKLREYYFAFDLENTQTMLEKIRGESIRVLHPDLGTVQGKLISVQSGMLVIQTTDGELRVINNYGDTQFVIEKSDSQDDLVTMPTLFCSLGSQSNMKDKTEISYLTTGINWNADYTAIIDETEKQLSLSTRALISNYSGKNFVNIDLSLLAGKIHRSPKSHVGAASSRNQGMYDILAMEAESDFQESSSFEYHSYHLGRNISLENHQQKVLPLYPIQNTEISKIYTYHYQKDPTGISVVLSTLNSEEKGLGQPLPGGSVRILKKDNDRLIILGEDNLPHTAVGEEIKLKIGQAFDIMAERTVLERKREGKNNEKMKISITFRNRKVDNIEILVTEPITRRYDYRILSSNIEVHKKEAKQIEFIVPVKANQMNSLEYEILYSW
jgi:hypothetical protein